MIPALESVIKYGGQFGVREIVFGMAHRGRLNVLSNVMAKPFRIIFHEFGGGSDNPEDVAGSGDVKYHLGTSTDREFDGISVHMSLVANPSHLEAEDPGRAGQGPRDPDDRRRPEGAQGLAAGADPRRRGVRRARASCGNASASPASAATIPAAASTSSSTTRSASPPARNSRAPRPIRRMWRKASRRRSSTSMATIPRP